MSDEPSADERVGRLSTGLDDLDGILGGGLVPGRSYMVRGPPGAGKTILGLHFLTESEDRSLFINLGQAEADVRADAEALGFDVDSIDFVDLSPSAEFFERDQSYDVFPSSDVDGTDLVETITEAVPRIDPDRVFVDPLTQFRYLTPDDYQFRQQVLSFLRFLKGQDCTTLFTSQDTASTPDDDLQFMSDGIVHLDSNVRGRTIEVSKFRGSAFDRGPHTITIDGDGMHVFPQLVPPSHGVEFSPEMIPSGVTPVDEMLSGGIERGTVTIIAGPSGVGKTTLGTQFMREAATRDEGSVIYHFEESRDTFSHRMDAIGLPVTELVERGTLAVDVVGLDALSAAEFAANVRQQVEDEGARVVMIDGIVGYRQAIRGDEEELLSQIQTLGKYLRNMGVTTILVAELPAVTGEFQVTDEGVSYLADNVVFLRYIEFEGELRKAIGVLKKRASDFERTLREFEITAQGIEVGEPLTGLRGILKGTPEWGHGPPEER